MDSVFAAQNSIRILFYFHKEFPGLQPVSKIKKTPGRNVLADRKNKSPGSYRQTRGQYANYFEIGHNAFEFVIEFSQFYPESEETELYARIIISPGCAKALYSTLGESIEQYKQDFESDRDK